MSDRFLLEEYVEAYGNRELAKQAKRLNPQSYNDFWEILNEDLEELVGQLESDAKDFISAEEDEITRALVRSLKARFYDASHETDEGGHVDVTVRSQCRKYSMLGEAKRSKKGSGYLLDGFKQLTSRYARGTPSHNRGAMLIYVQQGKAAETLARYKNVLEANSASFENIEFEQCALREGLAFNTSHVLERIGQGAPKYIVRHIALCLNRTASVQ